MARLARVDVFVTDEIPVVHVMARTVQRCVLPGDDVAEQQVLSTLLIETVALK